MTAELRETSTAIEAGIASGLHVGAQLACSVGGADPIELVVGEEAPGRPMTRDTLLPWFSMTKVVTSLAALQQWERGAFGLDDPVTSVIPEFGAQGKGTVTFRHLLTHTGGFRFADGRPPNGAFSRDLASNIEKICAAPLEDGWVPGRRAGYHPASGMAILAGAVERCDGRDFADYVRSEIFELLGMERSWIGMSEDVQRANRDHLGVMHDSTSGTPVPLGGLNDPALLARTVPGAGGRGPMHELLRVYECLLGGGARDGVRLASAQTVDAMLARHRVGMRDETFQAVIDWGLGVHIDMILFGRHCSPRAAGHGGAQSSVAFCDPEHQLAVAIVFNGMAGTAHHRRMEEVMTALYVDLGLASDAARDHGAPQQPV